MAKKKKKFRFGDFSHRARYRLGEWCLRGFIAVFPRLPLRLVSGFTEIASRLSYFFLWRYRKRMEENLSTVMKGELRTLAERRAMVRKAWRNFARGMYEITCAVHSSREKICSAVAVEGEEHLNRALARGKGVIALSAHLGNFAMIGARLAAAGYPFNVVVKQPRDSRLARLIDEYRARVGIKTISARPRREAARQTLKALRKNEIVLLIADEFKSGGVEVEFLGRPAPAPRGPATLALRTGAAVVPMFVTRDDKDRLTLRIGQEIDLIRTEELQENVSANAALFARHLEEVIRRYPDQWNWLGFRQDGRGPRRQPSAAKVNSKDRQYDLFPPG